MTETTDPVLQALLQDRDREIALLKMACTGYVREIERLRAELAEWESGAWPDRRAPADLSAPPAGVTRWRVKFVDLQAGTRAHYVNGHTAWDAYERTCRTPGLYPPSFGECEIRRDT